MPCGPGRFDGVRSGRSCPHIFRTRATCWLTSGFAGRLPDDGIRVAGSLEILAVETQGNTDYSYPVAAAGLKPEARELLDVQANDPFRNPPACEKLVGAPAQTFSRRIDIQHRPVYEVSAQERVVRVLGM